MNTTETNLHLDRRCENCDEIIPEDKIILRAGFKWCSKKCIKEYLNQA